MRASLRKLDWEIISGTETKYKICIYVFFFSFAASKTSALVPKRIQNILTFRENKRTNKNTLKAHSKFSSPVETKQSKTKKKNKTRHQ